MDNTSHSSSVSSSTIGIPVVQSIHIDNPPKNVPGRGGATLVSTYLLHHQSSSAPPTLPTLPESSLTTDDGSNTNSKSSSSSNDTTANSSITLTLTCPQLWIFGGADRMGEIYSDMQLLLPSSSSSSTPWYPLFNKNASSPLTKQKASLPSPIQPQLSPVLPLAGHVCASVSLYTPSSSSSSSSSSLVSTTTTTTDTRLIMFGGINFIKESVYNNLFEYNCHHLFSTTPSPSSSLSSSISHGWRTIFDSEKNITPSLSPVRTVESTILKHTSPYVTGDIPPGRTGHTLVTVPSPLLFNPDTFTLPSSSSSSTEPVLLSSIPGHGLNSTALLYLFGGSSPIDGPMNDLYSLSVSCNPTTITNTDTESLPNWVYKWQEITNDTGISPSARELHAAFIRPAVLQFATTEDTIKSDPSVYILQPPLMFIYGGRNEENNGMPRNDLYFYDLYNSVWHDPIKTGFAMAAAACTTTQDNLQYFCCGGQGRNGSLTNHILSMQVSEPILQQRLPSSSLLLPYPSYSLPVDTPLPATLTWSMKQCRWDNILLKKEHTQSFTPRFAATAACTEYKQNNVSSSVTTPTTTKLHIFGGMTVEKDLAELVTLTLQ